MRPVRRSVLLAAACLPVFVPPLAARGAGMPARIRHVLLLSIDGLHEQSLANCIALGSCPTLARLARHGTTYTDASTTRPSDSFPGTIAEITGGTPRFTGVYYDDTFDRALYPPSSHCKGSRGAEVRLTEHLDRNEKRLDGGSPAGLRGNSALAIDPARLPEERVDGRCRPLWPHNYLLVNTVFGVLHERGLRTAWIDKHPAYDILNGPGASEEGPGRNIDDFFAPEIDAAVTTSNLEQVTDRPSSGLRHPAATFTSSVRAVELYDALKVRAILEEIDGRDHSGRHRVGTPALFGMNFQAINVAEKRPQGGFLDPQATASAPLRGAIEFVDRSIGRLISELGQRGLAASTLVIVTAKHGNAPIDRTRLKIISDKAVLTPALNKLGHLDRFHVADDVVLEWLASGHQADAAALIHSLIEQQAAGTDLGIGKFYCGRELDALFGNPKTNPRAPDFILSPRLGVIYANHPDKIAEHGGFHDDDLHVALLVSNPTLPAKTFAAPVETTQIAPTILTALGIEPRALEAVRLEGTRALPDLAYSARR